MDDLPLLLAGPILRRVEPGLVSVWVATSSPCNIALKVCSGLKRAADFAAAESVAEGRSQTIRVGARLHVGVVVARPAVALLPDQLYSYDVTLASPARTAGLADLGLLADGHVDGKPSLSLGYETGGLPSFALPPLQLTDLRLIHGSCRRANKDAPDGLAWVDDFIGEERTDARARPHQLLLTGDQIYADDVARPMLQMLNRASMALIGARRDASEDLVPIEELPVAGKSWPADVVHFPVGYRGTLTRNEAKLTSRDGHSHLLSLGEFSALYLFSWSQACWPDELPPVEAFLPGAAWEALIPSALRRPHILAPDEDFTKADDAKAVARIRRDIQFDHKALNELRRILPRVRRALANVPTYMMFDDHEVTDDWNLNPVWRDRVFTSPLGKTILRNGLLSYALFQGWGNDPAAFESGRGKELLDHAARLFPEGAAAGPDATTAEKIDTLLGLDGKDPPVKWHYRVQGPRHLLLAIDNRTRRSFVSRLGPPGNVSLEALKDQVPDGPLPSGLEVLVVVAPLPVLGPPLFDDLIAPLAYRLFDLSSYSDLAKDAGSKDMPGTNPDAIEAWAFDPKTFEALLRRFESYKRVVILSGDVHFGSSQAMSYWRDLLTSVSAEFAGELDQGRLPEALRLALQEAGGKLAEDATLSVQEAGRRWQIADKGGKSIVRREDDRLVIHRIDNAPARYAQFTSSGMRNTMPSYIRQADRSLAFAQGLIRAAIATERLGWDKNSPEPLVIPEGARVVPSLRERVGKSPVMVPTHGWPEGTTFNATHPPDWSWRVEVLRDQRPDAERPKPAQPEPLDPAQPAADVAADLAGYRRVLVRQARQLQRLNNSRQILFQNNLGRVRFERRGEVLHAIHELYTTHPEASNPDRPELYLLHVAALESPAEKKPQEALAPEGGS